MLYVLFLILLSVNSLSAKGSGRSMPSVPKTSNFMSTKDDLPMCTGNDADVFQSCRGCDGEEYQGNTGPVFDLCGVCSGNNGCCGENGACSGHGACDAELRGCFCENGWGGLLCQKRGDLCKGKSCGENGVCDQSTGACHCFEGFTGPKCQAMDCGARGVYNPAKDTCRCFPGFTGTHCDECGGAPEGFKYLCAGSDGKYNLVKVPEEEAGSYNGNTISGMHFFDPTNNDLYTCSCAKSELNGESRGIFRNPREVTCDDLYNGVTFLLNEDIDLEEESSSTFWKRILDFQDTIDNLVFRHAFPIMIVAVGFVLVLAIALFIAMIVACTRRQKSKEI